jgi:hypothetical protein
MRPCALTPGDSRPLCRAHCPPSPSWRLRRCGATGPRSSQSGPVGVEAMKNRLHAIFTEDGKTNIIMSMYKKGARYKDIASETGLSIPSVRYRLVELSYKGLVDFKLKAEKVRPSSRPGGRFGCHSSPRDNGKRYEQDDLMPGVWRHDRRKRRHLPALRRYS